MGEETDPLFPLKSDYVTWMHCEPYHFFKDKVGVDWSTVKNKKINQAYQIISSNLQV